MTAAEAGSPVIIAAATNFQAAAKRAREAFAEAKELVILCAGRERRFALEDAYAALRPLLMRSVGIVEQPYSPVQER